jgi:undecaprenyl-diphosphatase
VVASTALFILIAEDVLAGGSLISHDQAVLTWFVDHRTDWMINLARIFSAMGGFLVLLGMSLVLGLWLSWRGQRLAIAIAPAVSLTLAGLSSAVAKAFFGRVRPPISVHKTHVTSPSFPSGHATDAAGFFLAAAFVLAFAVARRRRTQVGLIGVGILLVALIGLSRLVLAVHWLSDVVAGWALGTAIAISVVISLWCAATWESPRERGPSRRTDRK